CLTQTDLNRLLDLTLQPDTIGGLLAAPVRDTMKRSNADGLIEQTVERRQLWHALTPQMFPLGLLRASLQQALQDGAEITDEASALEYCGYHPQLVTGRADNLKVTQPEDLALADFFLSQRLSGADAQPS
ncbi:MAG: 2-C-methyl-D-erythritol 4-phosphate cytidylyltransferase, partial [Plesiomonas sp.]